VKTDYDALLGRLKAARCPYKLYPARLRALEIVTGDELLSRVGESITARIDEAAGVPDIHEQFQRDLDTYGLLEAIGYFHSYPPLPSEFVEEACRLYEELAALYLAHHEEIVTSDNPNVRGQIKLLIEHGDVREHVVRRADRSPRRAPNGISPPERPPPTPGYERRLPPHPDFLRFFVLAEDAADVLPPVANLVDELIEHFEASFMFGGFPGIQSAFFEATDALDEHRVEPFGPEGQYVLERLVNDLDMEMFGDYMRWIPCSRCDAEFPVEVSLSSVNESLLAGGWRCEKCRDA
jgi:hypothetical protein